ncbi:hypothetical protein SBP18_05715 [Rhodoferax ferrireducens]|uniref:hypothetical protein n=1 Tax=Rhodoferax ferrireducens TaxID=192843 RepID=UPI00298E7E5D|nr:hypothetical protein [Rhodoferax ferrireducens]WPC68010.1 hypothetical protein SBP18_05715 [Rhodoferax ferrireducens]
MEHTNFEIGTEFLTGTGQAWRCTDVGTRTIVAIEIHCPDQLDRDPCWFVGPPYSVQEGLMSRSKRKTPIFGIATARSEKEDKKIWHSRMRSQVRTDMTSVPLSQLESYIAPVESDVGNVWSMAKDGKRYFRRDRQLEIATEQARHGTTDRERESLKIRWLRKLRSK